MSLFFPSQTGQNLGQAMQRISANLYGIEHQKKQIASAEKQLQARLQENQRQQVANIQAQHTGTMLNGLIGALRDEKPEAVEGIQDIMRNQGYDEATINQLTAQAKSLVGTQQPTTEGLGFKVGNAQLPVRMKSESPFAFPTQPPTATGGRVSQPQATTGQVSPAYGWQVPKPGGGGWHTPSQVSPETLAAMRKQRKKEEEMEAKKQSKRWGEDRWKPTEFKEEVEMSDKRMDTNRGLVKANKKLLAGMSEDDPGRKKIEAEIQGLDTEYRRMIVESVEWNIHQTETDRRMNRPSGDWDSLLRAVRQHIAMHPELWGRLNPGWLAGAKKEKEYLRGREQRKEKFEREFYGKGKVSKTKDEW